MDDGHPELEVRVLYTLNVLELECSGNVSASLGNNLIVVGYILALKHDRVESGLTAVIYKYGDNLDNSLGVEKVFGESDGYISLDVACNYLKNLRIAAD